MDRSKKKEILDFFMEDSPWLKPKEGKPKEVKLLETKPEESKRPSETRFIKPQTVKIDPYKEKTIEKEAFTESEDSAFGEVDFAILKSITYGFKTIDEISNALQIRNLVVEKHIFKLIKEGFIKYFQFCVLTSLGKNTIEEFEKNNPEDIWKPIDEFIIQVIEKKKERNIKIQKTIDLILVITVILLIILIIYFGLF